MKNKDEWVRVRHMNVFLLVGLWARLCVWVTGCWCVCGSSNVCGFLWNVLVWDGFLGRGHDGCRTYLRLLLSPLG
ncbi:hypothetical protein BDQ17DRAFT_1370924 [Cyathus striatus]|nr:hypothetical protein BDQ17DRAFT_1370924 [Cyathus striatus]